MKSKKVIFKSPKQIIQIFGKINCYGKEEKPFEARKSKMEWKKMESTSGYIEKDNVYLPESILQEPDFSTCNLILLIDIEEHRYLSYYNFVSYSANKCFRLSHHNDFTIFRIEKKQSLELHLKWSYFGVGVPERANFKLCNIEKGKPVEVKINGKTDFSMSSRRGRTFKEQFYIFHHLGEFKSYTILKDSNIMLKEVPEKRKINDLIKPLW